MALSDDYITSLAQAPVIRNDKGFTNAAKGHGFDPQALHQGQTRVAILQCLVNITKLVQFNNAQQLHDDNKYVSSTNSSACDALQRILESWNKHYQEYGTKATLEELCFLPNVERSAGILMTAAAQKASQGTMERHCVRFGAKFSNEERVALFPEVSASTPCHFNKF